MNEHIEQLLGIIEKYESPDYLLAKPGEEAIEIAESVSGAAKYYEKIRQAVDYKDESLVRRNIIERTIKRKTAFGSKPEDTSMEVIRNLIQAGYIQNNILSKKAEEKVKDAIEKMNFLMSIVKEKNPTLKNVIYEYRIIGIAACEVEDILFPLNQKRAVADTFYNVIKNRVDIKNYDIPEHDLDIQIYIACHRGLLRSDETRLFYQLLLIYYPEWTELDPEKGGHERVMEIGADFFKIKEVFNNQIENQIQPKILAKLKNDIVYFSAIMGLIERYGSEAREIFKDQKKLSAEISSFIHEKYSEKTRNINSMAVRAIFYIFATKMILAFILEMPYDLLFAKEVSYFPLFVNVIFHPILLFLITRNIYVGNSYNTSLIIDGVDHLIHKEHTPIRFKIKSEKGLMFYITSLIYSATFLFSFTFIILILKSMNFNLLGMLFFVLFVSLVSFFGIRIRLMAKMWVVSTKETGMLSFLGNLLTLPVISFGRWLTRKFSSINVFVFIMDFIIETPFKAIIKTTDAFVSLVREKKEEIY